MKCRNGNLKTQSHLNLIQVSHLKC